MYENYLHLIKQVYSQFILNAFVFICVQKTRFFSFLNLISSIAKFKLDLHNNGIIFFYGFDYLLNHNLLTSKITKKEKLCQNIGPFAWQFCFFKMTLLSWFQVPGVFFFARQKPSKALYLEMNFEMKLYDSFLRIKKMMRIFLQLFRVSRYETIQTLKKKPWN